MGGSPVAVSAADGENVRFPADPLQPAALITGGWAAGGDAAESDAQVVPDPTVMAVPVFQLDGAVGIVGLVKVIG